VTIVAQAVIKTRDVAKPLPETAPVMTAIFPCSLISIRLETLGCLIGVLQLTP
jgi:hypothetical protein